MHKTHKTPIKARFIIVSSKRSIKPLVKTLITIFPSCFRKIQTYNDKCRFFYRYEHFLNSTEH